MGQEIGLEAKKRYNVFGLPSTNQKIGAVYNDRISDDYQFLYISPNDSKAVVTALVNRNNLIFDGDKVSIIDSEKVKFIVNIFAHSHLGNQQDRDNYSRLFKLVEEAA